MTVQDRDKGLKTLLKALANYDLTVGIHEAEGSQLSEDGDATIAEIGYFHEYGTTTEDGEVHISRASGKITLPCRVMLVAALNPCPCGLLGDQRNSCNCSSAQIERYRARLSGPLLDRIDIHIEAPDECSHHQETEKKVIAIERIDAQTVKTLKEGLDGLGEPYKIMILPDHATPLALRTHTADPVPFLIYDSRATDGSNRHFNEAAARDAGVCIGEGYKLMDLFIGGSGCR